MATLSAELAAVRRDHVAEEPVAEEPVGAVPAGEEVPAPVRVPTPGRHASRRVPRSPRGPALGGAHLAVLALVVGVTLAVTAWLVLAGRAEPEPLPEMAPAAGPLVPSAATPARDPAVDPVDPAGSSDTAGSADTAGSPDTAGAPAPLVVDVAGRVRRPGIVELPPGSRVVDALEAAGGPRRGVELTSLNLARPVVDGEQILVGVPGPSGVGAAAAPGAAPGAAAGPLVDLNTADLTTLETLPGVGPVTAQAILDWRVEHGGFTAVEELLEVDGIGDATLADLAPHVTI